MCDFAEDTFRQRTVLLKKYVDENESLQVEVINAAQVAVANLKHPPSKQ